ncbi:matrixin family metalloprotease [Nocardioides montaniterrae]
MTLTLIAVAAVPGPGRDLLRRAAGLSTAAGSSSSYAFETTQLGTHEPVAFSPCSPIHYVIYTAAGPDDSIEIIQSAVKVASDASGLEFAYDGTTTARPFEASSGPVVIGFADADEIPRMKSDPDAVGVGGALTVQLGARREAVSGSIALKASWFAHEDARGHHDVERAVVMHELGHVLGLAHVKDRNQIMYPSISALSYGAGDLRGLQILGDIDC